MTEVTRHTLFKPTRTESKQATTDSIARAMSDAETAARNRKTERLRAMRLQAEALLGEQPSGRPGSAKKPRATRRRSTTR